MGGRRVIVSVAGPPAAATRTVRPATRPAGPAKGWNLTAIRGSLTRRSAGGQALDYTEGTADRSAEIAALVRAAFADAEGAAEGAVVGDLARDLLETTPPGDIRVFLAETEARVAGVAIFTRLACADPDRRVMLLSPMAVATDLQGRGVGQGLLRHALDALREAGVEAAVTYGDPAFYARLGFAPVAPEVVPPPQPLTQPEGWLARPLGAAVLAPLPGPCRAVPALDAPVFW